MTDAPIGPSPLLWTSLLLDVSAKNTAGNITVGVVALGTLYFLLTLYRRRTLLGRNITVLAVLWITGLALSGVTLGIGKAMVPGPGHAVWAVTFPLLLLMVRSLDQRNINRTAVESPILADGLMVGLAWSMVSWRLFLWDGNVTVSQMVAAGALTVCIIVASTIGISIATQLTFDHLLAFLLLGMAAVTDIAIASERHRQGDMLSWWPYILMWTTWGLSAVLITTLRPISPNPVDLAINADSKRWVVSIANIIVSVSLVLVDMTLRPVSDPGTLLIGVVVLAAFALREMTRARIANAFNQWLKAQAVEDSLTGLGNRRQLTRHLEVPAIHKRSALVMDINRFKLVNTQLGHSAGDAVLKAVADTLREVCAEYYLIAYRLGGDEFCVLGEVGTDSIRNVATVLHDRVGRCFDQLPDAASLALSSSYGVATYDPELTPEYRGEELLTQATEALRSAKQERVVVRSYTGQMATDAERRADVERNLRRALANDTVQFHYQPVVNLEESTVIGFETLARWHDDELGPVSPKEFVAIAEQSGLIQQLGAAAINHAVQAAARQRAQGIDVYFTVNVSPIQLRRATFAPHLQALLFEYGVPPRCLKIEVTESIFIDVDDPAMQTVTKLADMGVGIAIDDFGSGYSSLGYITRLPLQMVKVDRSLTSNISDPRVQAIFQALVGIAGPYELMLLPEGIETEDEARLLRSLGITVGQGWLWSPAIPESDIPNLYARLAAHHTTK